MTNLEIVESFLNRKPMMGAVSTNGKEILSHGQVVARWKEDGIIMPDASNIMNKGVTRCRNLIRQMALGKGINVTQTN